MTEYNREFWEQRVKESRDIQEAVGHPDIGFEVADPVYKAIIKDHIKPEDKVLEAGCGIGRAADWFENYVGIDFVPIFIKVAREMHPNKTFKRADFNKKLPFKNKEFDWVVCISSFQYNEAEELKRVGKKILVLSYGKPHEFQIF